MKFEYAKSSDVMYVTLKECEPRLCSFYENSNGDIVRVEKHSGEVVGVTIVSFLYRIQNGFPVDIPEIGALPLKKQAARLIREKKRA